MFFFGTSVYTYFQLWQKYNFKHFQQITLACNFSRKTQLSISELKQEFINTTKISHKREQLLQDQTYLTF